MSEDVIYITSGALVALTLLSLPIARFLPRTGLGRLSLSAPMLATTAGILGTFVGIYVGLQDFDVKNIDDSIPKLLVGLKFAFLTSISGIGAAVLWRLIFPLIQKTGSGEDVIGPADIYATLEGIRQDAKEHAIKQESAFADLRQSISGEGDSSVVTQVQKLRSDINDGNKKFVEAFREFADKMAELSSKALIEALKDVIRDFNTQLNEQFGENFKQLNEAVGALLTWQEKYKEHVERLEERFEVALSGIEKSDQSLARIAGHTEKIPESMEALDGVMAGLQGQIENLKVHLEAVASLRDSALEAFPVIEKNLQDLTGVMTKSVDAVIENVSQAIESQKESHRSLLDGFDQMRKNSDDVVRGQAEAMNALKQGMENTVTSLGNHLQTELDNAIKRNRDIFDNANTEIQKMLAENFKTFDEQMQQQLTQALGALGDNLASLSNKFVEDYAPLTERLRALMDALDASQSQRESPA